MKLLKLWPWGRNVWPEDPDLEQAEMHAQGFRTSGSETKNRQTQLSSPSNDRGTRANPRKRRT